MKPDCCLTPAPIRLSDVEEAMADPSCGGHALFVGTVRDRSGDEEVERLEYEAYVPMALHVLSAVSDEAGERFGAKKCRIVHRIGAVEPGEIAVVVAVTAEHRREAFRACEYAVEELKRRAPIWKKEIYRSGKSVWVGGRGP